MTIPYYRFGYNGDPLPPVFPPVASPDETPSHFELEYTGNVEIERRVRLALSAFAITQFAFWQFSLAMAVLGALAITIGAPRLGPWFVPVGIVIWIIFASIMPLRILMGVRVAAREYAREGYSYRAAYGEDRMFWKMPSATYVLRFEDVGKVVVRADVAIVAWRASRGVYVLPVELTPGQDMKRFLAMLDGAKAPSRGNQP